MVVDCVLGRNGIHQLQIKATDPHTTVTRLKIRGTDLQKTDLRLTAATGYLGHFAVVRRCDIDLSFGAQPSP